MRILLTLAVLAMVAGCKKDNPSSDPTPATPTPAPVVITPKPEPDYCNVLDRLPLRGDSSVRVNNTCIELLDDYWVGVRFKTDSNCVVTIHLYPDSTSECSVQEIWVFADMAGYVTYPTTFKAGKESLITFPLKGKAGDKFRFRIQGYRYDWPYSKNWLEIN